MKRKQRRQKGEGKMYEYFDGEQQHTLRDDEVKRVKVEIFISSLNYSFAGKRQLRRRRRWYTNITSILPAYLYSVVHIYNRNVL